MFAVKLMFAWKSAFKWRTGYAFIMFVLLICFASCSALNTHRKFASNLPLLQISDNQRFLEQEGGAPFFWLGDTAWLLFQKLDREEADQYLEDRKAKGFNVIQAMLIHKLSNTNVYSAAAFVEENPAQPNVTPGGAFGGGTFADGHEYDYWDHVDYVIDLAARKGLYMALVPVWGSAAKTTQEDDQWATKYATWLAKRYRDRTNIIWLNGGDIRGNVVPAVWQQIGSAIDELAPRHLMTFHPLGRMQSSTWFHNASWLDFNMFQSGHRRYDQMGSDDPVKWKGEDSWQYVVEDFAYEPPRPTIDGEPSYEGIPQGLHDPKEPYWTDDDARRYAWWSVLAGAFGHTYGHNAVMQMHKPDSGKGAFGVRSYWFEAIDHPGAEQMQHLKNLMLSRGYFKYQMDQSLIAGGNASEYAYIGASRSENAAILYNYTGRSFEVVTGRLTSKFIRAKWFNPRNGQEMTIGRFENSATRRFDPPGEEAPGNDWVLLLDGEN